MDDHFAIQGDWAVVRHIAFGELRYQEALPNYPPTLGLRLVGCSYLHLSGDASLNKSSFTLDPHSNPKHIDLIFDDGHSIPGIYNLNGDELTLCLGNERPTTFISTSEKEGALWTYRRVRTTSPLDSLTC
jgi:uncharacterized protein (TIGR03067 family)